jgi:hypothetical protein
MEGKRLSVGDVQMISCRAGKLAGVDSSCDGRQGEVLAIHHNHEPGVGGGSVITYKCKKCNRRFVIST